MEEEKRVLTSRKHEVEDDDFEHDVRQPMVQADNWLPQQSRQAARAIALLLFFSFLMFTIPFLVFFTAKHYLIEYFHIESFNSNSIAVFVSVVSVNIIIGVYCYIAYKEPEYDSEGNLIDEDQPSSKEQLESKEN